MLNQNLIAKLCWSCFIPCRKPQIGTQCIQKKVKSFKKRHRLSKKDKGFPKGGQRFGDNWKHKMKVFPKSDFVSNYFKIEAKFEKLRRKKKERRDFRNKPFFLFHSIKKKSRKEIKKSPPQFVKNRFGNNQELKQITSKQITGGDTKK